MRITVINTEKSDTKSETVTTATNNNSPGSNTETVNAQAILPNAQLEVAAVVTKTITLGIPATDDSKTALVETAANTCV